MSILACNEGGGYPRAQSGSKSILIESPAGGEDLTFFYTDVAITIKKMTAVLIGSSTPSLTWTIRHDPNRAATGSEVVVGGTTTTDTTSGHDISSMDDPTIPPDSFVWIETSAAAGVLGSIIITVFHDED